MKKWFLRTISFAAALIIAASACIFALDPFNYFRWNGSRWFSSRFVTAGIIKNYDFDYAVMGSSMIQNMQMDWFRAAGYERPVKITKGGMDINEELLCLRLMKDEGKSADILLNIETHEFMQIDDVVPSSDIFPRYQFTDSVFDDYLYLFSYDAWFYSIPLYIAAKSGALSPEKTAELTDLDKMEEWLGKYKFGEDAVLERYRTGANAVSPIAEDRRETAERNIDRFVEYLEEYLPEDGKTVVSFPPYSVLYWADQMQKSRIRDILACKEYLCARLLDLPNVRIVDMQAHEGIADLNNYMDTTHFDLAMQKDFADCVLDETCRVSDIGEMKESDEKICGMAEEYIKNNPGLFEQTPRQR